MEGQTTETYNETLEGQTTETNNETFKVQTTKLIMKRWRPNNWPKNETLEGQT